MIRLKGGVATEITIIISMPKVGSPVRSVLITT